MKNAIRTYEVVKHGVFDIVLRDGVFSIDYLQFGSFLKWMLFKTQQVEDASESLYGGEDVWTVNSHRFYFRIDSETEKWEKQGRFQALTQMSCLSLIGKLE